MSPFEDAQKFFHAVDSSAGWDACKQYVADNAPFSAQSEPLAEITTVRGYVGWMAEFGTKTVPGCTYAIHASAYDEKNKAALFFATFSATHSGEGGPVPPTNKNTQTHYVYVLTMNDKEKVERMVKIWNAPWARKELGWI